MDAFDTAAVSYQVVLTKADKLKPAEAESVAARTLAAISRRPAAFPRVVATSAEKGGGLAQLRAEAASAALGPESLRPESLGPEFEPESFG
jgi:GTP-binding protein